MLMQSVESYLRVRRAAGFDLKSAARALRSFARFASARGDTHVRARTAIEWAARAAVAHRHVCLRTVAHFAEHLHAEDERHEVPPPQFFRRTSQRPVPFIFAWADICRIVEKAASVSAGCPGTYSALFGLLASTGMRVSEALSLRAPDVTPEGLLIRETKFRKCRLVPLHATAQVALDHYLVHRHGVRTTDDHVFLSKHRRGLRYCSANRTFRRLLRQLGLLSGAGYGPRPRIHSLRHSFAVRALENSPEGSDRIARHMLALSTYLGHSSIASTYWYLQATPQLLAGIADACEAYVGGEAR